MAFKQIKHPNQGIFVLCGTHLWGIIYTLSSCPGWCCADTSHSHFVVVQLQTALTVSRSLLNPSRPILFALAISRGKGLCLSPSLVSNSLFVFPLLIPIWSFHSSLLIDADCIFFFLCVFQCIRLGNSWGWGWGFKALKDGLITCRHAVRGFNRLCQPCLWVQRRADVPAWYPLLCSYWR